jgi:ATP-binding cassette, subfamily G (WHITE), member 2, SNQ2
MDKVRNDGCSCYMLWILTENGSIAIGHQEVVCSSKELSTLQPPPGSTCISYLQQYISNNGGYVTNPNATSACQFCKSRTTDEYFGSMFNIEYSHHWRDAGVIALYTCLNVSRSVRPCMRIL